MSETTRKSASFTIPLLLAGTLIAVVAVHQHGRIDKLESRVSTMERELGVLQPLVKVMDGHRPGLAGPENPYHAIQATGAPDVANPGADNPRAWCPALENEGTATLELAYDPPPDATAVVIHSSFNPGAVSRVSTCGIDGVFQPLWQGDAPADFVHSIPVSPPREIAKVRLELDLTKVAGWNEIDAVGLLDEVETTHWATQANASSVWLPSNQAGQD